jgi:hypothetical protein
MHETLNQLAELNNDALAESARAARELAEDGGVDGLPEIL